MNRSAIGQAVPAARIEQRTSTWDSRASSQVRRDEVTIWWASMRDTQSRLGLQAHLLSSDELRRAGWMPTPDARERWITGRASLRAILSGYLGIQALAVPISYGAMGKPELGSLSPVRFNLSHSADLAAFAVTWRKPVGIDVQRLRNDDLMADLAPWTFSDEAYEAWLTLPEPERRLSFARTWVRKEAYLKGRGMGLVRPLRELNVVESPADGALHIVDKYADQAAGQWRIFDLATPESGFVAALAVEGRVSSLISRGWPDGSVRATWRQP